MSGAKNCPETPRQKMISMMYLVLTAMLALNVSAEILKGFKMVDDSLRITIESSDERNRRLISQMEDLDSRNHEKIGVWLNAAKDAKAKSDELYEYIKTFKYEMVKLADGKDADREGVNIKKQDDTNKAHEYAITLGHGSELKQKIDDYREYVKGMFDHKRDEDIDRLFSTADAKSTVTGKNVTWVESMFSDMPLAASATMLTKYQSDIKTMETELIQFLRSQTDAKDFRVNEIRAVIIPESKNVVQGTGYKAQIILAARDTTLETNSVVNGVKADEKGNFTLGAGQIGTHKLLGSISYIDPISGDKRNHEVTGEFSVVPPSATVANQDMNVVYMGYGNRMNIAAPGFTSDKLQVSATNATIEKSGEFYICRPKSYDGVVISVSANVEGKTVKMGEQKFRVRALPNPTIFLRFKNAAGNQVLYNPDNNADKYSLKRQDLLNADVVAEYPDGLLQASFTVQNFTLSVSDGRAGFTPTYSEGNNFSAAQKSSLQKLKIGSKIFLEKVKVTGAKSVTLSYPPIDLP